MNFETPVVPWVDEIQNYLKDGSKKAGELKKVLKSADFEELSYADKARLYKMFDPKCEITEELFKRQIDLYFTLLESKSSPIKIPIFSEYIDWIYGQDISKMSDRTFDVLTSRLLKTKSTDLSDTINAFMERLPGAFDKDIDKLSNKRIGTLINILNEMDIEYTQLPQECKRFVEDMFRACTVKTEIADKNKDRMRRLFKDDPRYYYNIFNKAFAGVGEYEAWIDEPAKKITVPHMVNYANFQDRVLANYRKPLTYDTFVTYAQQWKFPKFPAYDKSSNTYSHFYLKEPREYKDYAKKMGHIFVSLVKSEMARVEELFDRRRISTNDLYSLILTENAKTRVRMLNPYSSKKDFLGKYSEFLIGLVHLDELTGQSYQDIYDVRQVKEIKPQTYSSGARERYDGYYSRERAESKSKSSEVEGQFSIFGNERNVAYREGLEEELPSEDLTNKQYTVDDLSDLYDKYNELTRQGKEDFVLAEIIVSLEDKLRAANEAKSFGDTE